MVRREPEELRFRCWRTLVICFLLGCERQIARSQQVILKTFQSSTRSNEKRRCHLRNREIHKCVSRGGGRAGNVYISDLLADEEKVRIEISQTRDSAGAGIAAKFDSSMRLCISDILNQGQVRCNELPPSVEDMDESSRLVIDYPISKPFTSSVFVLHIWLEDKSQLVKLCGSDVYIPVDVRLPNYGFGVFKEAVGLDLRAEVCTTSTSAQPSKTLNLSVLDSGVMCSRSRKSAAEIVHVFTPDQAQAVSGDIGAPGNEKEDTWGLCGGHEEYPPITLHLTDISSMQLFHAESCQTHGLADTSCAHVALELASAVRKAGLSRSLGLPVVQYVPSPTDPFIFLHMEKTAGSAIREFALHSANHLGLRAIVPCYQGLSCATFSISGAGAGTSAGANEIASDPQYVRNLAVVAGHFSWGIWSQLPSYVGRRLDNAASIAAPRSADDAVVAQAVSVDGTSSSSQPSSVEEKKNGIPSCFVVGRDPVDRIVSYYYQRCFETPQCPGYGRYLNDLSVDEFLHLARTYYQVSTYEYEQQYQHTGEHTGESTGSRNTEGLTEGALSEKRPTGSYSVVLDDGISNAACRSLSGEQSLRGYLNVNITTGEPIVPWPPIPLKPLSPHAREVALQNIEHCVVALAETWSVSAERIVRHWFPWMAFQDYTIFRTTTLMGDGSEKEKARYIRPELREAILSVNECDVKLYEKTKQLHDMQMEVLDANVFVF